MLRKGILTNKSGYSTGFTWIYGLVMIFGIGLIYIVFNQVFIAHLVPTIKEQVNNTQIAIPLDQQTEINGNIDKYMAFFHTLPYILFFVIVVYMIVAAVRKERESEFG